MRGRLEYQNCLISDICMSIIIIRYCESVSFLSWLIMNTIRSQIYDRMKLEVWSRFASITGFKINIEIFRKIWNLARVPYIDHPVLPKVTALQWFWTLGSQAILEVCRPGADILKALKLDFNSYRKRKGCWTKTGIHWCWRGLISDKDVIPNRPWTNWSAYLPNSCLTPKCDSEAFVV